MIRFKEYGSEGTSQNYVTTVAAKLTYFQEQTHLQHWQTKSYATHQALGGLYEYIQTFKDEIIEKLMGYTGERPTIFTIPSLNDSSPEAVVNEIISYASELKNYGEIKGYHDICNLADAFSGMAAKTKYLLTLS